MVWRVRGVTNSKALAVQTQCTSCPCLTRAEAMSAALYAAMEPVTPRMMQAMERGVQALEEFLPSSISFQKCLDWLRISSSPAVGEMFVRNKKSFRLLACSTR